MVALNRKLGALPMVGGNTAELIEDYVGSIQAMAEAIDAGRALRPRRVLHPGRTTRRPSRSSTRSARPASAASTVRVLSDHVAQFMYPNRKETLQRFAAMGAEYQPMLPLQPFRGHWRRPDLRNHRKLVVVDGVVGFTGSQNLIVDHYHKKGNIKRGLHWHELMVRLTGPAVRELDAVFVTDWYSETDELLPLDTSPVRPADDPTWSTPRSCRADPASTTTTTSSCSPR